MLSVGLDQVKTKPPTHLTMVEWAVSSLNSISEQIIQNAWRLSNYDYFPNEPRENETLNNEHGTSNNTLNDENISDDKETETKVEMLDFSDTDSVEIESVEIEVV